MLLSAELITKLLGAIETDSLVFLCGAGLSVAAPSDLPLASKVAQICYDSWRDIEDLPPELREDIDQLAEHFHANGDFERIFIQQLVPWNELVGCPNNGHAAIADLLISRVAYTALSANFDPLIEHWAEELKVAMQGALSGYEAVAFTTETNPLIKFHGCLQRGRAQTLWTHRQLEEADVQARVKSCSDWMNLHLPGKDIVVVGFWTDWGYLNDVLANAFSITNANSVTVIDPCPTAELEDKAQNLWAMLNNLSNTFEHVRGSGADALEEIRMAHSKVWASRFYALGQPLVHAAGGAVPDALVDDLNCEELYDLRRDAEGIPYTRAAKSKAPAPDTAQSAYAQMLLVNAGATKQGAWFEYEGQSIRVVNGAGQGLAEVQSRYREPVSVAHSDIIVCAGATELGVPAKLIPEGRGESVVRPAPGGSARWLTLDQAKVELGL